MCAIHADIQTYLYRFVRTVIAIINNAFYNRTRITMVLRIDVYQSLEFLNL